LQNKKKYLKDKNKPTLFFQQVTVNIFGGHIRVQEVLAVNCDNVNTPSVMHILINQIFSSKLHRE
jgi:hypothetical protein